MGCFQNDQPTVAQCFWGVEVLERERVGSMEGKHTTPRMRDPSEVRLVNQTVCVLGVCVKA
jgi:hypothetical protein